MDTALLWARRRAGDGAARAALIEQFVPLVQVIARGMRVASGSLMDPDDVRSAATLGLIDAVDRYDPDRGVPFEAYAAQRIRGAVIDEVRRIGDRRRAETAETAVRTVSFDELTEDDWQRVPAAITDDLDVPFEREDLRARVQRALSTLPPRQREVLGRYYTESLTLREAGRRMGISEARACQLHGKAIENLRRALAVSTPRAATSAA